MMIPPNFLISSKEFTRQMNAASDSKMFFAPAHNQQKQRATARFVDHGDGAIRHNTSKQVFRMLPGGRWVEEAVWRRVMEGKRLPCDP
jgi:hypothetical protein